MKSKYLFLAEVFLLLLLLETSAATYSVKNTNDIGTTSLLATGAAATMTSLYSPALDPTFSGDGMLVDLPGVAYATAVQPDGKIVAAGSGPGDFLVARYNPDGSTDNTFGGGLGYVTTDIGSNGLDEARSVAIQPDGKIVVAGSGSDCNNPCTMVYWAIVRYAPDGRLDTSFGGDGIVTTSTGTNSDVAYSIAIQPDGKIAVAGTNGLVDFALVRLNTDGSFDATFDGDGIVTTSIGAFNDFAYSVAIQADGKIVVAGQSAIGPGQFAYTHFALARYNPDGSLDTTFDSDGKVITPIGSDDIAYSVAIQPDGKLVAVGRSYIVGPYGDTWDLTLVRYNSDGSLDPTFDSDGKVLYPTGSSYELEVAHAVAIQPDGRIVATGFFAWTDLTFVYVDLLIVRFRADGSPSNANWIDFGGDDYARGIALDGFGRAVVVGNSNDNVAIARFLLGAPGRTKFDFDGDQRSDTSVFRPSDSVWYVNRSTLGIAAKHFGLATDDITPADYDGDGKTDIAVFRNGTWWLLKSATDTVLAYRFGQRSDIPVPADYNGDGRDELAVYRSGQWWEIDILTGHSPSPLNFGFPTDKPVPADYDGDGRADQAVYRAGEWYINGSTQGYAVISFGLPKDRPVVGDYDGDGKSDPAVYRDGRWFLLESSGGWVEIQWGLSTDIPVPADYDGDGKTDVAVFRNGTWYVSLTTGSPMVTSFGLEGDRPLPSAYLP